MIETIQSQSPSASTQPGKVVIERELAGRTLRLETGELAKQANGAVMVTYGDTVVICAATASSKPREGIDFFPLTVDYEEKMYAAGKIPGGFIKREGRPTEKMILSSRLIDRPLRPLFPEGFRNDVQVVCYVVSHDRTNDSDIPAMLGASAALAISDIPFMGPIAGVRVGRVNGEFLINPTFQQLTDSDINLVIAGTRDSLMMVEAASLQVSEDDMLGAFRVGTEAIRELVALIDELVAKAGVPKRNYPLTTPDETVEKWMIKLLGADLKKAMRTLEKSERSAALDAIDQKLFMERIESQGDFKEKAHLLEILNDSTRKDFGMLVKKLEEEELKTMIVDENLRPDGRKPDEIRALSCRVGLLPRTHGSGLFTRGQTQVLTLCTLGMPSEDQMLDGLAPDECKKYIHHYNFPPFSVGETRPMRGPGRREIGHGALAERALMAVLPTEEEFPYTVRLVSEVLESNGSTSMGSTCGSTLALLDAGVPIKEPVGGIAMGLVMKDKHYRVLTDIQGMEDMLGEMDFKVAGTRKGITAMQMDIKLAGVSGEILEKALEQARQARLQILDVMEACIDKPREELSQYAPRMFTMQINADRIKDVIGPGGKVINKIIAETGVKIDIENDGRIFIAATDGDAGKKAMRIIEDLTRDVAIGEIYQGKVLRLMNFGAFVEILPGKEGLVHISQLAPWRVNRVDDVVKIGDEIPVRVVEIDNQGRINLTAKGMIPGLVAPEGAEEHPEGGDRGERGPRPERFGRPGRGRHERGERPERGGRFDTGERDERPERGGRFDTGERPERPERGGRFDTGERPERYERTERHEAPEHREPEFDRGPRERDRGERGRGGGERAGGRSDRPRGTFYRGGGPSAPRPRPEYQRPEGRGPSRGVGEERWDERPPRDREERGERVHGGRGRGPRLRDDEPIERLPREESWEDEAPPSDEGRAPHPRSEYRHREDRTVHGRPAEEELEARPDRWGDEPRERAERAPRGERAERAPRGERAERAPRDRGAVREERVERPVRAEPPEREEKPERAERAERPERTPPPPPRW